MSIEGGQSLYRQQDEPIDIVQQLRWCGDGISLEAADAIERQRADIESLKECNRVFVKDWPMLKADRDKLKQQTTNLEKENDLLRHLLEPFAHQARIIDENDKADGHGPEESFALFRFRNSYTAICIGDCRRAREALKPQ